MLFFACRRRVREGIFVLYVITYDLKRPEQNYPELINAIKGLGTWAHPMQSTWLVVPNMYLMNAASEIYNQLRRHMDSNDLLWISRVTEDHQGYLSNEIVDWLKTVIL